MSDCAVPNCNRATRTGQLMCRGHWFEVPAEIRRMVNRTWAAYSAAAHKPAEPGAFRAAREAYERARTAAVESVTP